MTRDEAIEKIKKCLALGKSANEHEANSALRQASKLADAFGITDDDMLAAGACESSVKAGAAKKPSAWETTLAHDIAGIFGCERIFIGYAGEWRFIGCGAAPELASYAFDVLFRQAKRARGDYIKNRLKRCKPATKTRRADLFSEAWVGSVSSQISAYAGTEKQDDAIRAFKAKNYPSLVVKDCHDRNAKVKRLREHEIGDILSGKVAGKAAELNRGVGGGRTEMIGAR